MPPRIQLSFELPFRLDLQLSFAPLRRGYGDPTMRIERDDVWRATRTPAGPATMHVWIDSTRVRLDAWGPGAGWIEHHAPDLLGSHDDPDALVAKHALVRDLQRRLVGLRIVKTGAVVETLVPTILEQKVTGHEARRAYRGIVYRFGNIAPGPVRLRLPPDPAVIAAQPYFAFHRFGVERRRAEVIRNVCARARRLEEANGMARADALKRLTAMPGVGAWSAAEVAARAFGDPDAVPVGDFHIPHVVAWGLAGEARADDARMLELLEPYRGQRGRVIRLLEGAGVHPPKFGPRMPVRSIAAI